MRHQITQVQKIKNGGMFKVSIQIPLKMGWIERVRFCTETFNKKDAYQMNHVKNAKGYAYFETTIQLERQAMYQYYFLFEANGKIQYYKKVNTTGNTSITKGESWKMSVGFEVPEWAKGAMMYHIFVDRYRRGSDAELQPMDKRIIHKNWNEFPILGPSENGEWNVDFFGGDLKGIEETLDYIKSFGVDILYLSPIVRSQSNHRYDTADYENVDPYVGCNEDLKRLCDKAHRKGMKVILDAVFNHTGNDSKYFNQYGTFSDIGAYQNEKSPYFNFYKQAWNNGKSYFAYWWGMTNLPVCDGTSQTWREYIFGEGGVIDKWFKLGIDGLRLDVADELTDNFIEGIAEAVKRNKPDGFILGEVWKNPMRMHREYISSAKGMHSVMNYLLVDALIRYYKYCDTAKLDRVFKEILYEYPQETIYTLMNFTSTHDISRAIEIFGCDDFQEYGEWAWNLKNSSLDFVKTHNLTNQQYKHAKNIYKSYVFALAFLPGIFSIFYGDEAGVKGIGNLANRATYPWEKRDKDLVGFFRKIGRVRKQEHFFKKAEIKILKIDKEQLVYERYDEISSILVIASRTHYTTNVNIPKEYKDSEVILKIKGCSKNVLVPYGAIALRK